MGKKKRPITLQDQWDALAAERSVRSDAGDKSREPTARDIRPSLFLCHSSRDKEFVRQLASDLEVLGVTSWLDDWELGPGDSLHGVIGRAIKDAGYLAVVVSPDSVSSVWCQAELNSALAREMQVARTFVFPLVYRNAELPTFLLDKVHIDFSTDYYVGLAKLAGSVLQLNKRLMADYIASERCLDLPSVVRALSACGAGGMLAISPRVVAALREEMRRHGYDLAGEFAIIPDLKRRGGRGGGGPVAC